MRLRTRMIIIALAAAAGALLVVLFVAGPRLRERSLEAARATLFAEARLMARLVGPTLAAGVSSDELDRLVDAAAGDVRARMMVVSDVDRVRRALEVLVDNAIKYTAARHADGGGRVEIVSGPGSDGSARLEVVDNGPGSTPSTCPASSSGSIVSTGRAAASWAGPGSGSRSPGTSPRAWVPRSRWRASRDGGPGSSWRFRHVRTRRTRRAEAVG